MKRWICLFLSLAVFVSAFSLGVHAEDNEGPMFMRLYIGPNFSSLTEVTEKYVANRVLGEVGQYNYGRISSLRINTPGNYYFFFSFDISATDLWNENTSVTNTILDSSNVSGLENLIYDTTKYHIFWSTVRRIRFSDGGLGLHIEMYGVNNSDNQEQILIEFDNDILFHTESYSSSSGTRYFNNQIVNFQVHFQPDINSLLEVIDGYYSNWEDLYLPTINTFYNEFNQYWSTLVDTYIRQYWYYYVSTSWSGFYRLSYDQNGIASWEPRTLKMYQVLTGLRTNLDQYMMHQTEWENKAAQSGANDAYDDLNDSADFGSLSDFAGAGSAASWSSGSFSSGLSGIWDFFSNDTFYDLDTTDNRHDTNIYHEEYYQNNLSDYFDIVGSEYDGSTSD